MPQLIKKEHEEEDYNNDPNKAAIKDTAAFRSD